MIGEQDLLDAIAECQGEKHPNANTCIKLAAYYTILDHVKSKAEQPQYSYGSSEFLRLVGGLYTEDVYAVMDELMNAVNALAPKLYKLTMDRLREL